MSENIAESIPTSHDHRSSRPTKRRALSPRSKQSAQLDALFANPDKAITTLPNTSAPRGPTQPPEIVANVQGSSAGAGSGEFHVYKASRRREYDRLRAMEEEKEKEDADAVFAANKAEQVKRDAEKTERNRVKREKARLRKEKVKGGKAEVKKEKFRANVVGAGKGGEEKDTDAHGETPVPEEVGITFADDD